MGTNFYFVDRDGEGQHIGKRSAAGPYCWDCKLTLCQGGNEGVHFGKSEWDERCPQCGKGKAEESLQQSSAGRELGFNKAKPQAKTGVRSCSSFAWAVDPLAIFDADHRGGIVDEYGHCYTMRKFMETLNECPIRFYDAIGQDFS